MIKLIDQQRSRWTQQRAAKGKLPVSEGLEFVVRVVLIGIGATAMLDLWAQFAKRAFGIPTPNWGMVGRWIAHLVRGRFKHDSIAQASPVQGERMIGWVAHYAIGVMFAGLLVAAWGLDWARNPTPLPALVVGVLTVAAPFFVMQPGMGSGIAASRTPNPTQARLRSLVAHTVFGIGLYGAALLSGWLLQA